VSTAAADAARQSVLALLTTQVPDLNVQAAERSLEAANAAGRALWDVDAHLVAHPDALVSGSPDVPPSVFRLLVVLEAAGHPVRVPHCASCGADGNRWRSASRPDGSASTAARKPCRLNPAPAVGSRGR
jgi:hypothetical protein